MLPNAFLDQRGMPSAGGQANWRATVDASPSIPQAPANLALAAGTTSTSSGKLVPPEHSSLPL